jgi:hypothetical protein
MDNLPVEILYYISQFYNPFKDDYDIVINHINSQNRYSSCIRQLKQFSLYNRNGEFIEFCKYSILNDSND